MKRSEIELKYCMDAKGAKKAKYCLDVIGKTYPFEVYATVKTPDGKTKNEVIKLNVGGFHNKVKRSTVESNAKYRANKEMKVEVVSIQKIKSLDPNAILI